MARRASKRSGWITAAAAVAVLAAGYGLWARQGAGGAVDAEQAQASGPPAPPSEPVRNRLAHEASPYLQLHSRNPVDWYPWGDEAFARARAEGKPIFLSVGYSTCYWCHVMEREVFSDPEIAALMNAHFVSIKVDREERPDVDDLYMKATHLLTGSGGWPNSVFLTPDGKPFYAGSYFPPEDRFGRPGFPRVLKGLNDAWTQDRMKVIEAANQVTAQIEELATLGRAQGFELPAPADAMRRALDGLRADFDAEHGGFGRRTKFPRPPALELWLSALEQQPDAEIEAMLTHTLDAMALGGIYDHLAGGFHRYATEPSWSIPHFEKMLYDNAQLVGVYARAFTLTKRPLYRRVVEQTIAYLEREMSHPDGGFVSAQDAEVAGVEGASYLWSREEVERVLGEERAGAVFEAYELAPMREHPGRGVLRARRPAAAQLERFDVDRAALLAARAKRPQPLRDDKVLAAWNGLAIRGLVRAAEALDRSDYLRRAERAAHFVLGRLLREDGSLQRSYIAAQAREQGVLDDYAFLADGLLALHRATGDVRWRERARALADQLLARFEDPAGGGFFLTPEGSALLVRSKPFEDNEIPSGNAVALRVLRALGAAPGGEPYREAAARTARAAATLLRRAPSAIPASVVALSSEPAPRVEAASESPAWATGPAVAAFRLPRSGDHVRAALATSAVDSSAFVVRLDVAEGWHVNANPATLPFLVPTAVELPDAAAGADIRYPAGHSYRPAFAHEAIQVYEGSIEIPIRLGAGARRPEQLTVRFQACDAESCLPPDRSELRLDSAAQAVP